MHKQGQAWCTSKPMQGWLVITTHLVTKAVSRFIRVHIAHPVSSLLKSLSDNYGWLHYRRSRCKTIRCFEQVVDIVVTIEGDVSFGRKIQRDPAGNRTRDLLITSWTLLPLSHWTHGRGAEASLLITARLEASADSSCLSLCHRWIHCLVFKWRSPADVVVALLLLCCGSSGLVVRASN